MIVCKNCGIKTEVVTPNYRCPNCLERICRACGCTDSAACLEPEICEWSAPGVCSNCAEEAEPFPEQDVLIGEEFDFDDDEEAEADFGSCCACGERDEPARNALCLAVKKKPGTTGGWGCFVCDLPSDGAVAVVCDRCLENNAPVKFVVVGFPAEDKREPRENFVEPFAHDTEKHRQIEQGAISAFNPKMPDFYVPPLNLPLDWRQEISGVLPQAVMKYLASGQTNGAFSISSADVRLLADYLDYYINAPAWDSVGGFALELKTLREKVKEIKDSDGITTWILAANEIGLDPF